MIVRHLVVGKQLNTGMFVFFSTLYGLNMLYNIFDDEGNKSLKLV